MTCKQCSKQYTCNKEKCKPVLWHNTKNFGEVERKKKNMEKIKETIEFFEQQEGWNKEEILSEYIYDILKGKTEYSADELDIRDEEEFVMVLQEFADELFDKIIDGVINVLKTA